MRTRDRLDGALVLLFCCIGFIAAAQIPSQSVAVKSTKMVIHGSSNVNKFSCELLENDHPDTLLVCSKWAKPVIHFDELSLSYQMCAFDCGFAPMTADFQKTLYAKVYPTMQLQIDSIRMIPVDQGFDSLRAEASLVVTLAGHHKAVKVTDAYVLNTDTHSIMLAGRRKLKMSDFGIVPPEKFMGAVKVNDEIEIYFELGLEVIID